MQEPSMRHQPSELRQYSSRGRIQLLCRRTACGPRFTAVAVSPLFSDGWTKWCGRIGCMTPPLYEDSSPEEAEGAARLQRHFARLDQASARCDAFVVRA